MAQTKFKPFHETYTLVALAMSLGFLYPNPKTDRFRLNVILSVVALTLPIAYMLFYDVSVCLMRRDVINMIRHGTVVIPFVVTFIKIYVMYKNRVEAKMVIDEINEDHELFGELSDRHQEIVIEQLKANKFSEKAWACTVFCTVFIFPGMATASSIHSTFFDETPQLYMIHDLNIPYLEPEARFESPYFEFMNLYMLFCCFIMFFNFVGLDGFFGISINHACLKMKLYCKELSDAMEEENYDVIYQRMVGVIKQQNKFFRFVQIIQRTFNFWLGTIFAGALLHVCNCMYQIMEGYGFDPVYVVFIISSVIHIFLPCRLAGKLKSFSMETATSFYCSGWERVRDERIRKAILFMIARAQVPEEITAFNMLAFDMELFVSVMRASYSMFTVLRSS